MGGATLDTLARIEDPRALRALPADALARVAGELRAHLLDVGAKIGGHFAGSLGAVELTVALHAVFDTPHDRLVWDVGHQAYGHKALTGRRDGALADQARGRPGRLPAPLREPLRHLRRRPRRHLDLGRARHGRGGCAHAATGAAWSR